ncbi:hypothetical protein BDY21DRAFT_422143 [Lineolata rhizophorae]|uniref:Uncharacterized protein n=1 Tax=Lineolata rhizophorae TaxID=578093 RepID=A0A6A6NYZ3_9PEZI|nr:hypothetical protein BDY21DRAFT_422143 [Lineolata rhizophorae]
MNEEVSADELFAQSGLANLTLDDSLPPPYTESEHGMIPPLPPVGHFSFSDCYGRIFILQAADFPSVNSIYDYVYFQHFGHPAIEEGKFILICLKDEPNGDDDVAPECIISVANWGIKVWQRPRIVMSVEARMSSRMFTEPPATTEWPTVPSIRQLFTTYDIRAFLYTLYARKLGRWDVAPPTRPMPCRHSFEELAERERLLLCMRDNPEPWHVYGHLANGLSPANSGFWRIHMFDRVVNARPPLGRVQTVEKLVVLLRPSEVRVPTDYTFLVPILRMEHPIQLQAHLANVEEFLKDMDATAWFVGWPGLCDLLDCDVDGA